MIKGFKNILFFQKGNKVKEEYNYIFQEDDFKDFKSSKILDISLNKKPLIEEEEVKDENILDEYNKSKNKEEVKEDINETKLIGNEIQGKVELPTTYEEKDIKYLEKIKKVNDIYGNDTKVKELSKKYNIDKDLVLAIIAQESGGDTDIESPVKALGLMQLYGAAKNKWEKIYFEQANPDKTWDKERDGYTYLKDAYKNIEAGLNVYKYSLAVLKKSYKEELKKGLITEDDIKWLAVRGYNSGPKYFKKDYKGKKISKGNLAENEGHLKAIYNYYNYLKNKDL